MHKVVLIRSNSVNPDPPVEKVADTLIEKGYSVTILSWDRDGNYKEKEAVLRLFHGDAKIISFGIRAQYGGGIKKTFKQLCQFQFRIFSWLRKNVKQYDIIHAFDFDTGFIASICGRRMNKKIVYHILDYYVDSHGLEQSIIGRMVAAAEKNIINSADVTVICTDKRREQIKGTNPKKLVIIHNSPMQTVENLPVIKLGSESERYKIVYVGILARTRFIEEVIELVKQDERLEFHIGGFGNLEDEIVNQTKICERIIFYGRLAYEKTLALEAECDIMVAIYDPNVKNHQYSAPNKFYESLMLGKPIIMAHDTGFDAVIEENEIGIIIPYSKEGLKQGIEKLLNQRNEWTKMSAKSRALYDSEYSWKIMKSRLLKMYAEIIDGI